MLLDHLSSGMGVRRPRQIEVSYLNAVRQIRYLVASGCIDGKNQIRPLLFVHADSRGCARLDASCADFCGDGPSFLCPFGMGGGDQQQSQPALVGHA